MLSFLSNLNMGGGGPWTIVEIDLSITREVRTPLSVRREEDRRMSIAREVKKDLGVA